MGLYVFVGLYRDSAPLCCTGGMLGLIEMLYATGILPILSMESGNTCMRSSMLLMVIWSCNMVMGVECLAKGVQMIYGLVKDELLCYGFVKEEQLLLWMSF